MAQHVSAVPGDPGLWTGPREGGLMNRDWSPTGVIRAVGPLWIAVGVFGRLRNRRTSQTVVAQDATGGNLQVLLRMIDRRTAIRMFGMSALFIGPAGSARRVTGALPAPAGRPAARGLLARCPTQTDTWNLGANAPAKG